MCRLIVYLTLDLKMPCIATSSTSNGFAKNSTFYSYRTFSHI